MKRHKVLLFVLAVVAAYLLVWWLCPLPEMNLTLRLPSKTRYDLSHQKDTVQVADTVSVAEDTLPAGFLTLPDKTYFDKLFAEMSVARDSGTIVRILQYGDSQLEADRVSSTLRERLQEHFGGSGPGMVTPAPGNGTAAVNNYKSGGISRLTMYGEGSRAGHRRYGILCQLGQLSGSGTLFFKQTKNKHARPGVQHFSRVGLLVGNTGADFKATLYADTTRIRTITLDSAKTAVSYLTWTVPHEFSEGKIALSGRGELYGLAIDGASGVAVDNDGLRSCSGYIFTQIDTTVMQQSFRLTNTRLIIFQFGLNVIKGIHSTENVMKHVRQTEDQLRYLQRVAPDACILIVGLNDLDVRRSGVLMTYPYLSEYNDSLKSMTLRNKAAYFDLFNMMGGEKSGLAWNKQSPQLMGPDYTHFTQHGADSVGFALADEILQIYQARKK